MLRHDDFHHRPRSIRHTHQQRQEQEVNYAEFHYKAVRRWSEYNGQERLGQSYFNLLHEVRPDLANELRGSMLDPFFKERITQVVHDWVAERWDDDVEYVEEEY